MRFEEYTNSQNSRFIVRSKQEPLTLSQAKPWNYNSFQQLNSSLNRSKTIVLTSPQIKSDKNNQVKTKNKPRSISMSQFYESLVSYDHDQRQNFRYRSLNKHFNAEVSRSHHKNMIQSKTFESKILPDIQNVYDDIFGDQKVRAYSTAGPIERGKTSTNKPKISSTKKLSKIDLEIPVDNRIFVPQVQNNENVTNEIFWNPQDLESDVTTDESQNLNFSGNSEILRRYKQSVEKSVRISVQIPNTDFLRGKVDSMHEELVQPPPSQPTRTNSILTKHKKSMKKSVSFIEQVDDNNDEEEISMDEFERISEEGNSDSSVERVESTKMIRRQRSRQKLRRMSSATFESDQGWVDPTKKPETNLQINPIGPKEEAWTPGPALNRPPFEIQTPWKPSQNEASLNEDPEITKAKIETRKKLIKKKNKVGRKYSKANSIAHEKSIKMALKKSQQTNLKALQEMGTIIDERLIKTPNLSKKRSRMSVNFNPKKPYFRYFITLQQTDPQIGKEHVADHPEYRALPALYDIEQHIPNSRIKIWSIANIEILENTIVKHVTLAIDLNFRIKKSQLSSEKVYPGCIIIDIDEENANFVPEDGFGLERKSSKLRKGNGNEFGMDVGFGSLVTDLPSNPLVLLIQTSRDLNPFELYEFLININKTTINLNLDIAYRHRKSKEENDRDPIKWFRYQNGVDEIDQIKIHSWLVECLNKSVRSKILALDGYNGFRVRLATVKGMDEEF